MKRNYIPALMLASILLAIGVATAHTSGCGVSAVKIQQTAIDSALAIRDQAEKVFAKWDDKHQTDIEKQVGGDPNGPAAMAAKRAYREKRRVVIAAYQVSGIGLEAAAAIGNEKWQVIAIDAVTQFITVASEFMRITGNPSTAPLPMPVPPTLGGSQ